MYSIARSLTLSSLIALPLTLSGCGGQNGGYVCTADVRPSVIINVTHPTLTAALCQAQAIAWTDSDVFYEQGQYSLGAGNMPTCRFEFAYETAGTFTAEIKITGFERESFGNIVVTENVCHVETQTRQKELTPAATNCHDGYQWLNNHCESLHGCPFPQWEREFVPGANPGDGMATITYDCLNACTDELDNAYALPEAPGKCPPIVAP